MTEDEGRETQWHPEASPRKGNYFPLAGVKGSGALTLLCAFNYKLKKLNYMTLGAPSGSRMNVPS